MGVRKKMIFNIILVAVYAIFTVAGLICYKYGTNIDFGFSIKNSNINFNIHIIAIIGLIFYLMSFLLYMLVLPKFNLTDILPIISAITSIAIYILSIWLLGEEVTIQKTIGAIIIVLGVFIMGFKFK